MGARRIFGTEEHGLAFPPAYTCAPPFGVDIGGTNPAFWAVANSEALGYAQYDSWLTVGITEGDTTNALASIGIAFDAWDAEHPLDSSDDSGGGKNRQIFSLSPQAQRRPVSLIEGACGGQRCSGWTRTARRSPSRSTTAGTPPQPSLGSGREKSSRSVRNPERLTCVGSADGRWWWHS